MRLLFIGEMWQGSCARSLKEALARLPDLHMEEIAEERFFPQPRSRVLRIINRLTRRMCERELRYEIGQKVQDFQPQVLLVYKGSSIDCGTVRQLRKQGMLTINVYPDNSPLAYGGEHRRAVNAYDLVISTKPFHPALWKDLYKMDNRCVFVPQGYDPRLHLHHSLPSEYQFDVVMVATYRSEYGELMDEFAQNIAGANISVAIGGHGWGKIKAQLPKDWVYLGGVTGRSYVSSLRKGRVCIAPLTRDVVIGGLRQPGDEDTTRTYELAAAHCFFLHRRSEYLSEIYTPEEVDSFETGDELACKVISYLNNEPKRRIMARAAHERAVPAYSIEARAEAVMNVIESVYDDSMRAGQK